MLNKFTVVITQVWEVTQIPSNNYPIYAMFGYLEGEESRGKKNSDEESREE